MDPGNNLFFRGTLSRLSDIAGGLATTSGSHDDGGETTARWTNNGNSWLELRMPSDGKVYVKVYVAYIPTLKKMYGVLGYCRYHEVECDIISGYEANTLQGYGGVS